MYVPFLNIKSRKSVPSRTATHPITKKVFPQNKNIGANAQKVQAVLIDESINSAVYVDFQLSLSKRDHTRGKGKNI